MFDGTCWIARLAGLMRRVQILGGSRGERAAEVGFVRKW